MDNEIWKDVLYLIRSNSKHSARGFRLDDEIGKYVLYLMQNNREFELARGLKIAVGCCEANGVFPHKGLTALSAVLWSLNSFWESHQRSDMILKRKLGKE